MSSQPFPLNNDYLESAQVDSSQRLINRDVEQPFQDIDPRCQATCPLTLHLKPVSTTTPEEADDEEADIRRGTADNNSMEEDEDETKDNKNNNNGEDSETTEVHGL